MTDLGDGRLAPGQPTEVSLFRNPNARLRCKPRVEGTNLSIIAFDRTRITLWSLDVGVGDRESITNLAEVHKGRRWDGQEPQNPSPTPLLRD